MDNGAQSVTKNVKSVTASTVARRRVGETGRRGGMEALQGEPSRGEVKWTEKERRKMRSSRWSVVAAKGLIAVAEDVLHCCEVLSKFGVAMWKVG